MLTQIRTIKDVELFAKQLVDEGTSFHPDDNFHDYVNLYTDEPTYTHEEAELRNQLMEQAFDVCEELGLDIYTIMLRVFLKETGLDDYIPSP